MKKLFFYLLEFKLFRFSLVGVLNTLVGYGVIFLLLYVGFIAEVANTLGYLVGFVNSYFFNKNWTFKSKNSHKSDFVRFGISVLVAFVAQFICMSVSIRIFEVNVYAAQIIGGIIYVIVGFLLSKFFVFKDRADS